MSTRSDFDIDQGTNVLMTMELMNLDRSPKDLTNTILYGKMAQGYEYDSSETVHWYVVITDAPNGIVELSLTAAETSLLDHRSRYVWDVDAHTQESAGAPLTIERVAAGLIRVKPPVTP